MKPSQTVQALLRIAAKIENSEQPSRDLVAQDLQKLLAELDGSHTAGKRTDDSR